MLCMIHGGGTRAEKGETGGTLQAVENSPDFSLCDNLGRAMLLFLHSFYSHRNRGQYIIKGSTRFGGCYFVGHLL
jgi:hypothetical protein